MTKETPIYIIALFIVLVFTLLYLILTALYKASINTGRTKNQATYFTLYTAIALLIWLLVLAILADKNVLNDFNAFPPRMLLVLGPPLFTIVLLSAMKRSLKLLNAIPIYYLIYFQTFRVAMELILWMLYRENIIPVQMTFEGRNYDILIGLSALFSAFYYKQGVVFFKSKMYLIVWNVAGILVLTNIVIIAILSAPFPFRQFMNEPANTIIAYFPFVWLPGFVVPAAFLAHIFSLKQVLSRIDSNTALAN